MSNAEPVCKKVVIKTDVEDHDYTFNERMFFTVNDRDDFIIVQTYKDKEHTQLERKYVVNFKFIISVEYTYQLRDENETY